MVYLDGGDKLSVVYLVYLVVYVLYLSGLSGGLTGRWRYILYLSGLSGGLSGWWRFRLSIWTDWTVEIIYLDGGDKL